MCDMSSPAPPAPDYVGAANAQSNASKELTTQQTWANRPTMITPWGMQTWSNAAATDPATGLPVTSWTSNVTLSPQQQAALDSQMRLQTGRSMGAEALLQNALTGLGINLSPSAYSMPNMQQVTQAAASNPQAQAALSGKYTPGQQAPTPQAPSTAPIAPQNTASTSFGSVGTGAPTPSPAPAPTSYTTPYDAYLQNPASIPRMAGESEADALARVQGWRDAQVSRMQQRDAVRTQAGMPVPAPQPAQSPAQAWGGASAPGLPPANAPAPGNPPSPSPAPAPASGSSGKYGSTPPSTGGSSDTSGKYGTSPPPAAAPTAGSATGIDYSGIAPGGDRVNVDQSAYQMDVNRAPMQMQMTNTAGDWRQKGQQAALDFMAPLQAEKQSDLETQLANMGITRGSEAWNREMRTMQDQNMRDQLQAFTAGQSEANMLFNQDLQSGQFKNQAQQQDFSQQMSMDQLMAQLASQGVSSGVQAGSYNQQLRQQQIAELLQKRIQPLNELNALLTGQQVGMPTMPSFTSATKAETPNLLGATQSGYQASMDAYNAQQAGLTGAMNGLFSLGSAFLSDERLKTDKRKLFTLPSGVEVWAYRFIGKVAHEIGVLAQQVQRVKPHAVIVGPDGWLRVNYRIALEA